MTLEARFAVAMHDRAPGPIAVALSGGGDSMALLYLAHGAGLNPIAITVDHGLRDVDAELALCARACADLGLRHEVLRWAWDGSGNLQAEARAARRRLIGDRARVLGLHSVLLGHTRDDQAETVLLRIARGSGVDGLAGMAVASGTDPVWLRPLLDVPRAELRDWLRARGIGWAEDPSNSDPRFDRVRARSLMAELAPLGLSPERLVRLADHAAAARRVLTRVAAERAADVTQDRGDLRIPAELLDLSDDTSRRIVSAAVQWVAGAPYRPPWEALTAALASARTRPATLAGCLLSPDAGGVRIAREPGATQGPVPAGDLWDGRWHLSPPEGTGAEGLHIARLGEAVAQCPDWRGTGLPRASLMASPAVWDGCDLVAAPLADFGDWRARIVADFTGFLESR